MDITLFKSDDALYFVLIEKKKDLLGIELSGYDGVLIDTDCDEKELRRIVDTLKGKKKMLAVLGGNNFFNRRVLDTIDCDFLISPERGNKRDNLKQRDSGLNHVLARIAKSKGVSIVIDFTDVNKLDGKNKSLRLARIMQNVEICRKVGCGIKIATFATKKNELRNEKDLSAFMLSLGMSSQQAKDSVIF